MRHYKKILPVVVALLTAVACVDDKKLEFAQVEKPGSIESLEYLNNYAPLKTYVNRETDPNFKLGAGVDVGSYTSKGVMYRLINSNFDEVTAGWEMKHMAIVQEDGSLEFNTVNTLLEATQEKGISVYGHTLCWHENQNAKYLNSLIAPIVIPFEPGEPELVEYVSNNDFENGAIDGWGGWGAGFSSAVSAEGEGYQSKYALTASNAAVATNPWDVQLAYGINPLAIDTKCNLTFWIKGTVDGTISADAQTPANYSGNSFGSINVTTEWTEVKLSATITTADRSRLLFSIGKYAGTIYIDNISMSQLVESKGSGVVLEDNEISNGDFESGSISGWGGWGNTTGPSISANGEGYKSDYALKIQNDVATDGWRVQFTTGFAANLKKDDKYILELWVKGDPGTIQPVVRNSSTYQEDKFSGSIKITNEWTRVELSVIATTDDRNSFLISYGNYAGVAYLDDISVRRVNPDAEAEIIEKTPEEKKQIITGEMERWISAMVENCKPYVKAWDVVNEPMSDWPNPYELKTGVGKELADLEFYWQDYMGKDYAVMAFKYAEQYGNPEDILFINDYGLESNTDKCKGLIEYVEYIESKGARVDGIGTQMHLSLNTADKGKIEEMFRLLAATGKKIKISELDMGIDKGITTDKTTEEQLKGQAELYQFVIEKYFEIIPANQRYGITMWSPLDSPDNSSWRANEPIGLWTLQYDRKHAYAGFANGLAGRDISAEE